MDSTIREISSNVAPLYEEIRRYSLGQGEMKRIRDKLTKIYNGLYGITHTYYRDYEPDERGGFYIVGKAKVLMFIWGQTPGFDRWVIENFSSWTHAPAPYQLPHVWVDKKQYTPEEFCDVIEEFDQRVVAWNEKKEEGKTFQSLSPNRPVGRIIDIIYLI